MGAWIAHVAGWLYFGLVLVLVVVALLRRREPAAALGWSLAIVFIPALGILLFLLFGVNRLPRRLRRKIEHHDLFRARFARPQGAAAAEEPTAPEVARWAPLSRLLEGIDERPRRTGNALRIFDDGAAAFDAMTRAIAAAKHHVHVEFYIFRHDDLGRRVTEVLARKCKEGVQVRVLVDAVGSAGNRHLVRRIREAGGQARRFLPIQPFGKAVTPNLRNHRKLVVCDGRRAYFGGLNVGREYLGRQERRGRPWYDLHVEVQGPAVWDLQQMFVEDWDFCAEDLLDDAVYFPELDRAGDVPLQVVAGGPDQETNAVRQAYFGGIVRARERIRLATPYLVPDLALRDALTSAARTGVDVRILTPHPPGDSRLTYWCGQYYAEELLAAGVRVFAYRPGMMHAKAIAVDGCWGMIGTANLDNRSLGLNFEQMAVLDGRAPVGMLERALAPAFEDADEITLEALRTRPWAERSVSSIARLFAPLL